MPLIVRASCGETHRTANEQTLWVEKKKRKRCDYTLKTGTMLTTMCSETILCFKNLKKRTRKVFEKKNKRILANLEITWNIRSFFLTNVIDGRKISSHAEDILFYFDFYHVKVSYRREKSSSSIRIWKIPPIFPPFVWNVYEITLKGIRRTNNLTKVWNNQISKICSHKHPTVLKLIKKMRPSEIGVE